MESMDESGKYLHLSVKSAHNQQDKTEEMRKEEVDLLNLIAEIIVEIIVRKTNERDRLYTKK